MTLNSVLTADPRYLCGSYAPCTGCNQNDDDAENYDNYDKFVIIKMTMTALTLCFATKYV